MRAFDSGRWLRASRHLDRMLDLPPHERAAGLAAIREQDPDIATDVEAMLEHHRQLSAEGFLDAAPPAKPVEVTLAGVTVGAYTLASPIGYGGMGSVWLASRSDGRFEGQVAVKLLNAALVGRTGEERFRREGTILARLAHPHIARLIDAGVSNTGQPYLVLELIEGRHIDVYCDDRRLTIEQRIRLFLDVLSAVSHAHANLIVHRDLKPSNVLVTTDGQVKLLDFSIAKLIEDDEASRLTRDGAAMTPKYAAPEQINGGPITTATDVFALGVLLYELLSGQHPSGSKPQSAAEFARAIADAPPLRLSASLSQAEGADAIARLAADRSTTPDKLARELRGDLDTILNKALKKEPSERYGSVSELADDLRRYIDFQPISARPDTITYRTAKFVRRHWQGVVTATAALVAVTTLIGFYTVRVAAERDRAQREAQKASRISEVLTSVFASADPYRNPDGTESTDRGLLDLGAARVSTELGDQPDVQAELLTLIGRTFQRMGQYDKALPLQQQALDIARRTFGPDDARVGQSLNDLGVLQRAMGNYADSEALLIESLALRRKLFGNDNKDVAVTLVELARVLRDRGRVAEAEAPIREALAIRTKIFGDEHRETATSKNELGQFLLERGDLAGAEPMLRQNAATSERVLGADHPNAGASKANLAGLLVAKGEYGEAEALMREALRNRRVAFGEHHVEYAVALANLAGTLDAAGKNADVLPMLERALNIAMPQLGLEHPRVVPIVIELGRAQIANGQATAAESGLRQALAVRQRLLAPGDWRVGYVQSLLGAALFAQKRYAEAKPLMIAADQVLKAVPGRQARERDANRVRLAALQRVQRAR